MSYLNHFPRPDDVHTIAMDFDGVFTNNMVWLDQNGVETVCCDRGDGLAVKALKKFIRIRKMEIQLLIISGESNPVVGVRAKKLGIVAHRGVLDKKSFLDDFFKDRHVSNLMPFQGLVYLGNDLNDLNVMRHARFSVAPLDAHPRIKSMAKSVLPVNGGEGFVRAFVEKFIGLSEMSDDEIDELVC